MTVTSVGGDPRDMAALVIISRGMMIGGGPISKIEAHIAAASSGGPREPVVISGYWVGQRLMRRAKQILEGYQPARLEVVTCL